MQLTAGMYNKVSLGIFVGVFAVLVTVLELVKPEFVTMPDNNLMVVANGDEESVTVDHLYVVTYSVMVAAIVTVLYAVFGNMWLRPADKLSNVGYTSAIMLAVFMLSKIIIMFSKPKFILHDDGSINMAIENSVSAAFALIAGIIGYAVYSRSQKSDNIGMSSTYNNYRMSYPMQ